MPRRIALVALLLYPSFASAQRWLVAGNKPTNTATIVDLSTGAIVATLPTGLGPHEAAISNDAKWAIITDYGTGPQPGHTLTLIDIAKRAVARTIDLGRYRRPHGVQFLNGDSLVAVSVEADSAVLVVRLSDGTIKRAVGTGQRTSHMVSVRRDSRVGYTSNIGSSSITEVELTTGATRVLSVGEQPEGIGTRPDGSEVWVGSNTQGTISVVDVANWKVAATIQVGERPYRVSFTPDGALAIASLTASSRVRLYDPATRKELATIAIPGKSVATDLARDGAQPVGVAFSADSRYAYVACQGIDAVAVIDLQSRRLLRTIAVGPAPDAVAVR